MGRKPQLHFEHNEHQQAIFEDYLQSQRMELTAQKFGVTRQRVQQIIKLFGYKRPFLQKPTEEEKLELKRSRFIRKFWARIDKTGEDECWNWSGCKDPNGYGHIHLPKYMNFGIGKSECAHRIAWIFSNGEIPEGMNILHTCDNPPCCNPSHLYLGTQKENCRDRDERFYQNGKVPIRKKYRTIASKRELPAEIYPQEPE
jgi:hypothetical protein